MKIAIIGGGNLGMSIAKGISKNPAINPEKIIITRKRKYQESTDSDKLFDFSNDNRFAVQNADLIILAILPQQLDDVLNEIKADIDEKRHSIISVVTGAKISSILNKIEKNVVVVRAMPNIAAANNESMTCISVSQQNNEIAQQAETIFSSIGKTKFIAEDLMTSATALCACGIAFFLRMVRSISQAGTEIGFHAGDSLEMAIQTAKGAILLLEESKAHPEQLIDKVTSPKGCTIIGLNEMEHEGFSPALIKGVRSSKEKADKLYE